jgi:hypothetical protein|tara:strand:+ start:638 stop:2140 length:1503 start_codon:yes stop_codon:yes gene_type:complete
MIVFYTLLAKYLNTDPEIYNYLINYQYDDFNKFKVFKFQSNHYYLTLLLSNIVKYKNDFKGALKHKYTYYQENSKNIFMTEKDKNSFFQIFGLCQKHYLSLSKFVNIVKFKKLKPANESDMYLNDFNKDVCTIIQNNRKYLFTLFDLKEIINTNLSNLDYGFVDVTSIKNPYNNIPFSQSNLYNIYFYFKFHYYNLPNLFHLFFLSNFDLAYFERHYEYQIKKQNLQNKIKSLTPKKKREEIINMFKLYNKFHKKKKIEIPQDDFPDDTLCSVMNNYLKIYLSYKNSSTPNDKNMHKDELFHRLKQFQIFNPTFGRTYIYRRMKKRVVKYDDKHIKFNEYSRIGLHDAHIEKIQFPQYVSISANNDNHMETEREDFFNIFRHALINRESNDRIDTALIQQPIIAPHINDNVRPFFLNFDLSSNPIQSTQFVYRTPPNEYNEIIDTSDNYFDAFYDNETSSTDDTNSIPPLISVIEGSILHDNDDQMVVYDSDDSSSGSNA